MLKNITLNLEFIENLKKELEIKNEVKILLEELFLTKTIKTKNLINLKKCYKLFTEKLIIFILNLNQNSQNSILEFICREKVLEEKLIKELKI